MDGRPLPLLARPLVAGVDLAEWLRTHRDDVARALDRVGAILFRGFAVAGAEGLEAATAALSPELLEDYVYASTPRSREAGRVFTSTEYPAQETIPQHNELSYARSWPLKLWFHCVRPAAEGGETPLSDSRRVLDRIDPAVREEFAARGVRYVRNYGHGVDLPWSQVFGTADRAGVERFCVENGIEWEWGTGDRLRTWQTCQGVGSHPRTREEVWFNQATLFHPSSLPPAVREALVAAVGEGHLPRTAQYGDGAPIGEAELAHVRAAYDAETLAFTWQAGDLLLVDNMLVAHGRRPFTGERKVLVTMAEPWPR
jgi:hypothetical protein